MVRLESHAFSVLKKRNLGIFPRSVVELAGADDLLLNALNVEYRIHLQEDFQELIRVSEELLLSATAGSVEWTILSVSLGHLLVLTGRYQDALSYLLKFEVLHSDFKYVDSLKYKRWYLIALCYKNLNQAELFKDALITGLNALKQIPLDSDIESWSWLILLYQEYHAISKHSISELITVFTNQNFLLSYTNYLFEEFSSKVQELTAFINERSDLLLKGTRFPSSTQSNNYELEEFLDQVSKTEYYNSKDLIEKGIAKTYQSIVIIRAYTATLLKTGNSKEIKAAFEVYLEYVESYYVLNNHSYADILSILTLFKQILDHKFKGDDDKDLSDESYSYYLKVLEHSKNLLSEFYKIYELTSIEDHQDILKQSSSSISQLLKLKLSDLWFSIGNSTFKIYQSSSSILSQNISSINKGLHYYENSIHLNQSNHSNFFSYVRTLAVLRHYKESYKYLKTLLKITPADSLSYFKSWHLYALILSIEENKEESFKIISFLANEIIEYLHQTPPALISFNFKQTFVEIKITQLAIIESLYGIEQTLDSLPELFQLFNEIFKDSVQPIPASSPIQEKHRRSLSRTQTITKIKSIGKSHKPTIITPPETKSNLSIAEQKLLQKIWLLTSIIYSKLSLTSEAEQAIIEAENCYKRTSETHSTLALLTISKRPTLSLKEFENALNLDKSSNIAIIGFSNLILNHEREDEDEQLFVDEKDRLAGIARAKLLLESIVETFSGGFKSEVWWLLSKIYEKNGDKKRLNLSLWKCIELEESRSVREFECV